MRHPVWIAMLSLAGLIGCATTLTGPASTPERDSDASAAAPVAVPATSIAVVGVGGMT